MKIGLTGASGILGTNIKKKIKKKLICYNGLVEDKLSINRWIKKNNFDVIIHLASVVSIKQVNKSKKKAYNINYIGTKNLIDSINFYSKKKVWFFYASTSHVYPFSKNKLNELSKTKPINFYGKTKLLSERYILSNCNKIKPCIGRIFSFTKFNQSNDYVIKKIFMKFKEKNKLIKFKNFNHERDFLSIDEISKAILILLKKKAFGIYNICSGNKINLKDIIIKFNSKLKKNIIFIDNKNITTYFGSNKKLKKIGWKKNNLNYLNYLIKEFKLIS